MTAMFAAGLHQGLEFIVLGSAVLAAVASLTDTSDFAEGLSRRMLGVDDTPSPPEPNIRKKEVKVRNPVTGRWINFGGRTYSQLVSQGLLVEGDEVFEQPALAFSHQYQRTVAGEPQVPQVLAIGPFHLWLPPVFVCAHHVCLYW